MKMWNLFFLLTLSLPLSVFSGSDFPESQASFMKALKSGDESGICDAMESLAEFDGGGTALILIEKGMSHPSLMVHEEALRIARGLKSEEAHDRIVQIVRRSRRFETQIDAMRVMQSWPKDESRKEFIARLEDKTEWIVTFAVRMLRDHPHSDVVSALIKLLEKADGRLREDISDILENFTGETFPLDSSGWKIWWENQKKDWKPSPNISESDMSEEKPLTTAVKDGLYGEIASDRVVFLLDISGSMLASTTVGDSRMEIARNQLKRVLQDGLTTKSKFTVVAFSEDLQVMSPKLVKSKGSLIKKAMTFVDNLEAGGETNTYGALQNAFSHREVDTIYLLSDGSPKAGKETSSLLIEEAVSTWNRYRGVRVHCIGFFAGTAKNQDEKRAGEFLRRISSRNFGRYTEIR